MRNRKNKISRLRNSSGKWIHDREERERMANNYFMKLFSISHPSGINEVLEDVNYKIDQESAAFLISHLYY